MMAGSGEGNTDNKVKLLGFWASPFSLRVEWALRLKGIEYEYVEEDIFNKSPLLVELNPVHKRVPVLVHGTKAVAESLVILEYLDETWKDSPPLLPSDPFERALARFFARFSEEKVMEAAFTPLWSQGDEKESAIQSTIEGLEKLEQQQKGNKFFGGENIGYLDLVTGWISYWLPVWEEVGSYKVLGLEPNKFPVITEWAEHFLKNPAIKEKLPPREEMVPYFHGRGKAIAALMASRRHG